MNLLRRKKNLLRELNFILVFLNNIVKFDDLIPITLMVYFRSNK